MSAGLAMVAVGLAVLVVAAVLLCRCIAWIVRSLDAVVTDWERQW